MTTTFLFVSFFFFFVSFFFLRRIAGAKLDRRRIAGATLDRRWSCSSSSSSRGFPLRKIIGDTSVRGFACHIRDCDVDLHARFKQEIELRGAASCHVS